MVAWTGTKAGTGSKTENGAALDSELWTEAGQTAEDILLHVSVSAPYEILKLYTV